MSAPNLSHDLMLDKWREYSRPRFGNFRQAQAWAKFQSDLQNLYGALAASARRHSQSLNFDAVYLGVLILVALDKSCEYCGQLFGLESFGIDFGYPPERVGSAWHVFSAANLCVCCARCTVAKQGMTSAEWLAMMQALKVCETGTANELLDALVRGRRGYGDARLRCVGGAECS